MRVLPALVLALLGCAPEASYTITVAQSAESKMPAILSAVDDMNAVVGFERFVVRGVSASGERRDGEIVIRGVADLGRFPSGQLIGGETWRSPKGLVIRLDPSANSRTIAHELGHCAGLNHVHDPTNLMDEHSVTDGWHLEDWQLDELR